MKKISFPRGEWSDIRKFLEKGKIITTRCGKEFRKYKLNKIYIWRKWKLKVKKIKVFTKLEDHLYFSELNFEMNASIQRGAKGSFGKYELIWLEVV